MSAATDQALLVVAVHDGVIDPMARDPSHLLQLGVIENEVDTVHKELALDARGLGSSRLTRSLWIAGAQVKAGVDGSEHDPGYRV